MTSYWIEFPDFRPATMPPIVTAGFHDTSWRDDACPSFTSDALGLILWIDYASPAERERPTLPRFRLYSQQRGVETSRFSLKTNDIAAINAAIKARLGEISPAELNQWYADAVGYRPQGDNPAMPDRELRELCAAYFDELLIRRATDHGLAAPLQPR
jgi:hypothetical protein